MTNPRQLRSLTLGLSVGAATGALALAIVFLLTFVATQAAQAQTFNVIHTFTGGQDGGGPHAGLTMHGAGNLYGTALLGLGYGTVYELKHKGSGWVFNPLYSFAGGSDGAYPYAGVVFGPDGLLYGTTSGADRNNRYGTVFNLRPSPTACKSALCPWTETVLYAFQGGADGAYPEFGDLLFDRVGNIYGTTEEGGVMGCSYQAGCGTVYELSPSRSGWTESVLYAFTGPDGQYPSSGIILDNTGNLYGTTGQGGLYGGGTVFQLVHSTGWTESLLHSFGNGSDGSYLYAGLIFDQSGNLYGATSDGGENGGGTVFELSLSGDSWTYSLLYSFTGRRGYVCGPWGTLVMDAAGNFYGTTNCDGAYNAGSVFKLTNTGSGWTYTSLHGFTGGSDGGKPYSNVIFDTSGNIYGTALTGGSQCNCGVVWEITP